MESTLNLLQQEEQLKYFLISCRWKQAQLNRSGTLSAMEQESVHIRQKHPTSQLKNRIETLS